MTGHLKEIHGQNNHFHMVYCTTRHLRVSGRIFGPGAMSEETRRVVVRRSTLKVMPRLGNTGQTLSAWVSSV
jgi:hypothetical protein